ncbi:cholesterol oxidase [Promicromonospora umidemergens]|uniref:Cholesterol oxidase n=1 Tax=Promicromonospora umidemergens TaxID=629679 RepID=A0ABP8XGX0_9MICO|nr:GMC family oxidoreductase [Promicromonospora umidemergens]MCP2284945.1 cholesterol oxidase [Promicromonospora umidemergens]
MSDTVHADAIVVGSGFGGAVAAARLAQAGYSVTVLERGRRWRPGDFPREPALDQGWLWSVDRGLYDIRWLDGMLAVQAAGWGGGSLAYANVFARPFDAALSDRWPAHLRRAELDPYYDLAAHMLGVAPVGDDPRTGQAPARTTLIEQLMQHTDRPDAIERPNLAVTFGDPDTWRPNRHGVPRRGCAFVGECVIGCNHGAKNSLDATYLAAAERNGARSVTDAEVTRIRPSADGYRVTTTTPSDPDAPPRTWSARRVILAAGAVATTELLLRSRVDRTLPRLSPLLGHGFSGNGDFLTLAELRQQRGDMTTGPTITTNTVLDVPEGRGSVWYQVQDGAFPAVLHDLFDSMIPGQRARNWWRRRFAAPDARRVFTVLAMGHDSGDGTLRLDRSGNLVLSWRNRWQTHLYRSQRRVGPLLARLLDARLYHPITWSVLRRTTTVHPLGGVRSGHDATSGVVDDIGEVHGHPGIFVVDGSTLPASTGVNPSATILAAAERSIEAIIRRDGCPQWRAPEWPDVVPATVPEDTASSFAADLNTATSGGGIAFDERMVSNDRDGSRIDLHLTVEQGSIDQFLADPDHALSVRGTVDVSEVATSAVTSGTLALFADRSTEAMRYELCFDADSGQPWRLTGTKTIKGRAPWRPLVDLTRLHAIAHPVDDPTAMVDAILVITPRGLASLLGTVRGTGFTRARRIRTAARFATFFARSAVGRTWGPRSSNRSAQHDS